MEFSGSNTIHHLNFQPQVLDFSTPIDSSIISQALLHSSSGRPNAWPDECAEAAMGQGVILVLLFLVFILVCLVFFLGGGMWFSFFPSGSFFPSLFLVCSRCCVFVEPVLPEGSIEIVEMQLQLQLEKVYDATPFSSLTFSVFTGDISRKKAPCSRRPRLACQWRDALADFGSKH